MIKSEDIKFPPLPEQWDSPIWRSVDNWVVQTDFNECLKHSAKVNNSIESLAKEYAVDVVNYNIDYETRNKARAWDMVAKELTQIDPCWHFKSGETMGEIAVKSIRQFFSVGDKKKEPRPFDLEAAMRGEPLVRRDGISAKFVAYVAEASDDMQVIVSSGKNVWFLNVNGLIHNATTEIWSDVFMAPKPTVTKYLNLYKNGSYRIFDTIEQTSFLEPYDVILIKAYPIEVEEK